jgi:hypothetical protein
VEKMSTNDGEKQSMPEVRDDVSISDVIQAWMHGLELDKGWALQARGQCLWHHYELVGYRTEDFLYIVKYSVSLGHWWEQMVQKNPELESRFKIWSAELWRTTPFLKDIQDSAEIPF